MRLQSYNVDSEVERTELVRQRRLCGWGEEDIPYWLTLIRKGDRVAHSQLVGLDEAGRADTTVTNNNAEILVALLGSRRWVFGLGYRREAQLH